MSVSIYKKDIYLCVEEELKSPPREETREPPSFFSFSLPRKVLSSAPQSHN